MNSNHTKPMTVSQANCLAQKVGMDSGTFEDLPVAAVRRQ